MRPKGRWYPSVIGETSAQRREIPEPYWGRDCRECFPIHWSLKMISTFKSYMKRIAAKGMEFNLTFDDFESVFSKTCVYCGDGTRISIDRIDSSIGYVTGNIQPACVTCNMMKYKWSDKEFRDHIGKISSFNSGAWHDPVPVNDFLISKKTSGKLFSGR